MVRCGSATREPATGAVAEDQPSSERSPASTTAPTPCSRRTPAKDSNRPIVNDRYYTDGFTCVVEFEVELDDSERAAIVDVFTVDDTGHISRLAVYRR